MDIYDIYVKNSFECDEYKKLYDLYRRKFGRLNTNIIPGEETLGGFKEKVEESVRTGYSTLPEAYCVRAATAWVQTARYMEISKKYSELTGEGIPLMQIGGISIDDLEKLVNDSVAKKKDLLAKHLKWNAKPRKVY